MADRAPATKITRGRRTDGARDAKSHWGDGELSFIEQGSLVRDPDKTYDYNSIPAAKIGDDPSSRGTRGSQGV